MSGWAKSVFLSLVVVLSLAEASLAQSPTRRDAGANTVTITVFDSQNRPLKDARVEIRTFGMQSVATGYTNHAGVFEASNVPNGEFEAVVQKGLAQASERSEAGSGFGSLSVRLDTGDAQAAEVGGSATVSIAQYKVPKKAREQYRKAQKAVAERKVEEAHGFLAKALEIHPEYAEALTMRGLLHLEAKNTEGAISDFDKAIKADAAHAMAYIALGAAYNLSHRFDEALASLDRGVALAPQSWQAYFEMGKAHIGKGDYQAAVRVLDKSQNMSDGKYPLIHLLKAHALLAVKQYQDAMAELQAFVDQAPQSPHAADARNTLDQVKAFVAQR